MIGVKDFSKERYVEETSSTGSAWFVERASRSERIAKATASGSF